MSTLIQPPPPAYRKWWWVPVTVVIAALVIGAVIWKPEFFRPNTSCGGDGHVVRTGSDDICAGITDGSVEFDQELADIQGSILQENQEVTGSDEPYVSVVLLTPMTSGENDVGIVTMAGIRHRLEGAHLAQLAANEKRAWGDLPKIQLLLANPGSGFEEQETAVDAILKRRDDDNIVAVTGISFSVKKAFEAINKLNSEGMPVVGSTLTTDELSPLPGLLRVSPSASAHARAAAEYLAPRSKRVLIVRDDSSKDSYGRTLAKAFEENLPGGFAGPAEPYDSVKPGIADTFGSMMPNICEADADTIYFAGRATHALGFIEVLGERRCDTPITVVTGDDMPYYQLSQSGARVAMETGGISVLYTGLAHERVRHDHPDWFSDQSVRLFAPDCSDEVCYRALSRDNLDDFAAITEYDAVITAVEAIRLEQHPGGHVQTGDVLQAMNRLRGPNAPYGATGQLAYDDNGLPSWKPIPILEARVGQSPRYVALPLPMP